MLLLLFIPAVGNISPVNEWMYWIRNSEITHHLLCCNVFCRWLWFRRWEKCIYPHITTTKAIVLFITLKKLQRKADTFFCTVSIAAKLQCPCMRKCTCWSVSLVDFSLGLGFPVSMWVQWREWGCFCVHCLGRPVDLLFKPVCPCTPLICLMMSVSVRTTNIYCILWVVASCVCSSLPIEQSIGSDTGADGADTCLFLCVGCSFFHHSMFHMIQGSASKYTKAFQHHYHVPSHLIFHPLEAAVSKPWPHLHLTCVLVIWICYLDNKITCSCKM